jgi:hypothetical protein
MATVQQLLPAEGTNVLFPHVSRLNQRISWVDALLIETE